MGCQRPNVCCSEVRLSYIITRVLLSCLSLIHNQAKIPRGVIPPDSMTFMMDLKCKRNNGTALTDVDTNLEPVISQKILQSQTGHLEHYVLMFIVCIQV